MSIRSAIVALASVLLLVLVAGTGAADDPPAALFRAWTEPDLVESWWGPEGFKTIVSRLELWSGGAFHFEMISPSGGRGATAGTFRAIEPNRRLVLELTEHCNCDLPPGALPQLGRATVTVEFRPRGAGTHLIVTHEDFDDESIGPRLQAGWASGLECLAAAAALSR